MACSERQSWCAHCGVALAGRIAALVCAAQQGWRVCVEVSASDPAPVRFDPGIEGVCAGLALEHLSGGGHAASLHSVWVRARAYLVQ